MRVSFPQGGCAVVLSLAIVGCCQDSSRAFTPPLLLFRQKWQSPSQSYQPITPTLKSLTPQVSSSAYTLQMRREESSYYSDSSVDSQFYESLQSRIFQHRLEENMILRSSAELPSQNATILASFACPLEDIREIEMEEYHWSNGALNIQPSDYFEEIYLSDE
mmetsp:Transcript_34961/g.49611  ORF Transcript_34961/g.49611 Transcript_34961/m.49611 type:complete len:162 (+) Transcript_34961:185-670(+)|eukprot:CAMPEP_0202452396 /NCGR_PEP_ID=MMETSP1360-20130828/10615_1 /ASSEMBLY_ACC=CAM_ASM_000848 /TAXON_ID=515479 /ORGANISM="Licmophora paradoxa, Strain CCMP2313" /LENGTH=161 /DNA_ID=CAMNT_0049071203 /DNA_START=165 /DNA_END=650 /DNA_ORIENTATION=+